MPRSSTSSHNSLITSRCTSGSIRDVGSSATRQKGSNSSLALPSSDGRQRTGRVPSGRTYCAISRRGIWLLARTGGLWAKPTNSNASAHKVRTMHCSAKPNRLIIYPHSAPDNTLRRLAAARFLRNAGFGHLLQLNSLTIITTCSKPTEIQAFLCRTPPFLRFPACRPTCDSSEGVPSVVMAYNGG